MEKEVKVINFWTSMFGLRVPIALKLKGIEYEHIEEDLQQPRSQLLCDSNSVYTKIPVLIHKGKPVCESAIILQYIDEAWPHTGPPLLPQDPHDKAVARFWVDFIDKKVYGSGCRVMRQNEDEKQEGIKDLVDAYMKLEHALANISKGKTYFGGDELNYIDVGLAAYIHWFQAWEALGNFKLPGTKQCPSLNKWIEVVSEHPAVKPVLPDRERFFAFTRMLSTRYGGPL